MAGINLSEIVNLGFAVFVAVYLLTRLDKTLQELNDTIQSFKEVITAVKNENERTNVETAKQSEFLQEHDGKLDDLINEVDKIPKRGEQ